MLLALEADEDAVLGDDEFVLALKDAFEVLLVEVDASELIDYLIDRLDQLNSVLEVIGLINLLRK